MFWMQDSSAYWIRWSVDSFAGEEALQRDLDKLTRWVITSHMKCNESKCQILHLRRGWPWLYVQLRGWKAEVQPHRKESGGSGWWQVECEPAGCPGVYQPGNARQVRDGIVPLCTSLVYLHLKHCMQVWAPQYKKLYTVILGVFFQRGIFYMYMYPQRESYIFYVYSIHICSIYDSVWGKEQVKGWIRHPVPNSPVILCVFV